METQEIRLGPGSGHHPDRAQRSPSGELARIPPADTLADAVAYWAEHAPERRIVYALDERGALHVLTARGLLERARAIAAGLRRLGVGAGEAVILAMDTSPALVASFLACTLLGATPSISDLPFSKHGAPAWQEKLRARAELLAAKAIVASRETAALVEGLGGAIPVVTEDALASGGLDGSAPERTTGELAFVQFTSGTVSAGRAIRLSNRAVMANLRAMEAQLQWTTSDLLVSWLPLYHDLGLVANLLLPLSLGIPVVLMSPLQFLFQPSRWLWAVHHFRATTVFAPNFAYEMCAAKVADAEIEGLDLRSLRDAFNCAEFIHESTLRRFTERYAAHGFTHDAWIPAYGMAEVVVGASTRARGEPLRVDRISRRQLATHQRAVPVGEGETDAMDVVSCGRMMPGYAVRIVDAAGAPLPERNEGMIQISGPSLFDGYHREEEATGLVLRDGWLSTGDLGYLADGELFVCGRSKDLIIKGGENYHPYAFERAVTEIKGVRAGGVAAIGAPNEESGTEDLIIVFETEEKDPERLRAMCAQIERELGGRFGIRPDRVVPVAPRTIPKTTSGKIRRKALSESLDHLDKLRRAAPTPGGAVAAALSG